MANESPVELATPPEVAQFLHISEASLAQDHYRDGGIPFIKVGKRVRYRWSDVYGYLDANTMQRNGVGA
jgi:hypothetical protein